MSRYAFLFIADTHLGLKTGGIDRRAEIINIYKTVIKAAVSKIKDGYTTRLILGGDLFDDHDPSEDLIATFISILNMIRVEGIETDIIIGNHEAVAEPQRLSCLSFIRELGDSYPMLHLRENIKTISAGENLYVTYLPHITRATLKFLESEYDSTQEYIDKTGKRHIDKINKSFLGKKPIHLAFSHLNVRQSKAGSESNLLKKSEAFLPLAFINPPPEYVVPTIINGHIHERQEVGNVYIAGSPLFCSFGETQDKTFTTVLVDTDKDTTEVLYTPTPFIPFLQTEVEMIGEVEDFFSIPEVVEFLTKVVAPKTENQEIKPVIKIQVTISAENNTYNWAQVRDKIEAEYKNVVVMPIDVKVVQKRVVRNIKQKASLEPDDAIKVYLKANLKNDMDKAKRLYKKSKPYLGVQ